MERTDQADRLTVGIAQITPVWLDRSATLEKIMSWVGRAADEGCGLVAFGEALLPGYPFWIERTDGARFESDLQKEFHSRYLDQAVCIERGDLDPLRAMARERAIAVVVGTIERPLDRGGHSVYCSLVLIDAQGAIATVHRKLVPTYEERLSWASGDGHGLRTHAIGPFTVGGLNCWENWMPLARSALYAQGEDLHVAIWPGNLRNTKDITRFAARESRSYIVAASGLMRAEDVPADLPHRDRLLGDGETHFADGGSCVAGPDGNWVIEPVVGEEGLYIAELDHGLVRRERHNFDPAGHYGRPDITRLSVDRRRQSTLDTID